MYWTCGQCCVFHTWVLASNIVIRLYVLDMWSVLCVLYVQVVSIKYSDRTVRTGHVVSVVCSICGCWRSNIAMIIRSVAYWTCGQCCVFHIVGGSDLI